MSIYAEEGTPHDREREGDTTRERGEGTDTLREGIAEEMQGCEVRDVGKKKILKMFSVATQFLIWLRTRLKPFFR